LGGRHDQAACAALLDGRQLDEFEQRENGLPKAL
jgi:hypothetical protein